MGGHCSAGTEEENLGAIRTVLEATTRDGTISQWCTDPDCPEHGSQADTESITSSVVSVASNGCDDPDCTEHGACLGSGEEEDVVELICRARTNINNNTTTSEDGQEAMMREIERKIEEAGETVTDEVDTDTDEILTDDDEEKPEAGPQSPSYFGRTSNHQTGQTVDLEEAADEALTNMIDQMINSLQRSEASDELIDLAKELCKIINSTTSATAGVV